MSEALSKIITRLDATAKEAKEAIADAAMAGEYDRVQKITEAVKALVAIQEQLEQLSKPMSKALDELEKALAVSHHTKGPQTTLRVSVKNTQGQTVVFDEKHASETLKRFIEFVTRGHDCETKLRKIATITSGGGAMVSRHPTSDFINPKQGTHYSYLPIGGTGWSVKTQTSTEVKVAQIREILIVLGLPSSYAKIETSLKS